MRHYAELAAGFGKVALHIAAQHRDGTGGGARQTGEDTDHGGLTRTIGAKQAEEFTLFDIQTDAIERHEGGTLGPFG